MRYRLKYEENSDGDIELVSIFEVRDESGNILASPNSYHQGETEFNNIVSALENCSNDNNVYKEAQCLYDVIDENNIVPFKRIVCYDPVNDTVTTNDRTFDLTNSYTIQGTETTESELGENGIMETLPFCDDGKVFYRTFNILTGQIVRQFDGSMNDYIPSGQVSAGECTGELVMPSGA